MDEKVQEKGGVWFYARVCFGILPPLNCSLRPSIPPLRTQNKPSLFHSVGRKEGGGGGGGEGSKKREPGRPRATMETRNSLARGKKKGVALPVNSPVVVFPPRLLTALPRGHFAMETALDERERASVITVRTLDSLFRTQKRPGGTASKYFNPKPSETKEIKFNLCAMTIRMQREYKYFKSQ